MSIEQLKETFEKTGIETTVSAPQYIEEKEDFGTCIRFSVTFRKGDKSLNVDWYCGLGLVPLPFMKNSRDSDIMKIIRQGKKLKDKKEQREVATRCANEGQKKMVNPAEVFARILDDHEMILEGFDEFCSNCSYDTDSIKALNIYREIEKQGKAARALVNNETAEKLVELVREL